MLRQAQDLAQRLNSNPLVLISEAEANNVASVLAELAKFDPVADMAQIPHRRIELISAYGYTHDSPEKPFAFAEGIAFIPVHGMLLNRLGWGCSWATGYTFIRRQLNLALEDPDVKQIVFDINSYGGEAAGCMECAEDIFKARSVKPTLAVVDAHGYSAGYWIGAAAKKMVLTPSGGVGSIGVIALHIDITEMLKDAGIKVTVFKAGERKGDGYPFVPLTAAAKKDFQQRVDNCYESFVAAISRNRDILDQDIRDTEARAYQAEDALRLRLVDKVQAPSDAVSDFLGELGIDDAGESDDMNGTANPNPNPNAPPATVQAPPATAQIDQAALNNAVSLAVANAMKADRTRRAAITTCEEATGREELARHLAENTEMDVDAAKAVLKASPKNAAKAEENDNNNNNNNQNNNNNNNKAKANPFVEAMDGTKNPNVGANPGNAEAQSDDDVVKRMLANHQAATGIKHVGAGNETRQ